AEAEAAAAAASPASPLVERTDIITPKLAAPLAAPPDNVPQVVRTGVSSTIVRVPWGQGQVALDPTALEPDDALEKLRNADGRDAVFHALIRGVRSRTKYAASLVVQGDSAFGREAIGEEGEAPNVGQIAVALPSVPAFRTAVASGSPYIGPVATGDVEADL